MCLLFPHRVIPSRACGGVHSSHPRSPGMQIKHSAVRLKPPECGWKLCVCRIFCPISLRWLWFTRGTGVSALRACIVYCTLLRLRLSPPRRVPGVRSSAPFGSHCNCSHSSLMLLRNCSHFPVLRSSCAAPNSARVCSVCRFPTAFILPPLLACTEVVDAGCRIICSLLRDYNPHRSRRMDPVAASMDFFAFMSMPSWFSSIPSLPYSPFVFLGE